MSGALSQHPGGGYFNPRRGRACIGRPWSRVNRYRGLVRGVGGASYWIPRESWAEWRRAQAPEGRTAPA